MNLNKITVFLLCCIFIGCSAPKNDYSDMHDNDLTGLPYERVSFCMDVPPAIVSSGAEFDKQELMFQMGSRDFISFDDKKYFVPTLESVRMFNSWVIRTMREVGLRYLKERFDCENFSGLYVAMFHFAARLSDNGDAQAAVADIAVEQYYEWGGVPPGGRHALVALAVESGGKIGVVVIEPQNPRKIDWLDKYPNEIYRVKL